MENKYTQESRKKLVAGGKKSAAIQIKRKKERIAQYNKLHVTCEFCKKKLEYEKRNNRFCDRKCSAINSNQSKIIIRLCINCNKLIKDSTPKSKYCTHSCQRKFEWRKRKDQIEKTGIAQPIRTAKKYMLELKGYKCDTCGRTKWNKQVIPITLDHINGDAEDWNLSNLRLLCPNCDAQTDTYKGKNRGNGRHWRRQRYKEGKSY